MTLTERHGEALAESKKNGVVLYVNCECAHHFCVRSSIAADCAYPRCEIGTCKCGYIVCCISTGVQRDGAHTNYPHCIGQYLYWANRIIFIQSKRRRLQFACIAVLQQAAFSRNDLVSWHFFCCSTHYRSACYSCAYIR